jgi:lysophospholipase L1-like esterase
MLRHISADDTALVVHGACAHNLVRVGLGIRLRLHRPLDMQGKGYGWDNPGACISFRTDAAATTALLHYSGQHVSTTARNGVGLILVDDVWQPEWIFDPGTDLIIRPVREVEVELPVQGDGKEHTYTLVMPYGDSVEFAGLRISSPASLIAPPARPRLRWVAYGDSVTQGFDASHIGTTYPWLLSRMRGWELINLGLGGRTCIPGDAPVIAACRPDLLTIAIGVNDWQGGADPEAFAARLAALLRGVALTCPATRTAVISPLWVADAWRPATVLHPVQAYRQAAAQAAGQANVPFIDGSGLIDHDPALFDHVAVHPRDAGFASMASRLADRLPW